MSYGYGGYQSNQPNGYYYGNAGQQQYYPSQQQQGYYNSPYSTYPSQGYYQYQAPPPQQPYYGGGYTSHPGQYYRTDSGPSSKGSSVPSTPYTYPSQPYGAPASDDYEERRAADNSKFKDSWIHKLVEVPTYHEAYSDIRIQFRRQWRHTPNPPAVHKIFRISDGKLQKIKFKMYRGMISLKTGEDNGNTIHSWHGTVRACNIGDNGDRLSPCKSEECSLCKVIRKSYDISLSCTRHKWGRFGQGIYTSSTSSKAYHYTADTAGSRYAALLLNEVVMGNAFETTRNASDLTQPPDGYDSVKGIPHTQGNLNYDEAVVYTNKAIRPMYLVLVERIPGWKHHTCLEFEDESQ
ncbi:PARP catalytic domain-containing protein [Phanerochaete sordida]|uniref:PARP catalytic domain-containing protein n=1 Tax=Phanerochaete sordida TaxID=48140 RepID=A0A9P3GIL1_9APHY|nr:PARP catalytic domain-containing protein [Phanerochaete sordida]